MRKFLSEKKLIRTDLKLSKDKEYIYFPLIRITDEISSFIIVKHEFEEIVIKPKSYKEIPTLPEEIKSKLPTSYDIIGNIIIIKLGEELLEYKKEIGDALLRVNKNIKSVFKIESVKGEFRTRKVTLIAGKNKTATTHVEYGLSFDLDVEKTYFSPRLANERKRVAKLVSDGEIIVDMFAGVAPFSIMIAKNANPKIVYSIDKNKDALIFAKQNIIKNNVLDKIELIHADAKKVVEIIKEKADRIIMNLPFSSHLFFKSALGIANKKCIIHYYDILDEDKIENRTNELGRIAEDVKFSIEKFEVRKIKSYTPREFYIGIDITAKKMPM